MAQPQVTALPAVLPNLLQAQQVAMFLAHLVVVLTLVAKVVVLQAQLQAQAHPALLQAQAPQVLIQVLQQAHQSWLH